MDGAAYAVRMDFGTRLAALRRERELTQEELGRGLGTDGEDSSKSVVLGWEKGRHFPKVDQLALICQRLDCSADYLLFGVSTAAYSPGASAVAQGLDSLHGEERRRAMRLCNEIIKLAQHEASSSEKDQTKITAA